MKQRDKDLIEQRMEKLIAVTAGFCDAYLDKDYKQLCEKLIRKMSQYRIYNVRCIIQTIKERSKV
jgi:hypothetical protein